MRWANRISGKGKTLRVRMGILAFLTAALAVLPPVRFSCAADSPIADASRQFEAGKYQQATATLRAALEQKTQDAGLYYWLARCYYELRDFEQAIANAQRAVELAPGNSEYHLWLGRAYGLKSEQASVFSGLSLAKKTRQEFEEAVRLDPLNFEAQHDLIEFYFRAPGIAGGGDDKARRQIEALAALDAVEGHVAWGDYWWDKKKFEQAEAEFRQVLDARSQRVSPYLEAADFYLSRNDAAHLEKAVEAAVRVNPSDRRLIYYQGVARILAGNRLEEAERLLRTYLGTVPQRSDLPAHTSAQEWLGRLYEREGKCNAAVEHYRKALDLDPHNKAARESLRHLRQCPPGE
jgi:tetratricopeptide (TPR) repeat protein